MYTLRNEPENARQLATLYWRVALLIAFILVLCSFAYGISDLLQVLDDLGQAPDAGPQHVPSLNREELQQLVSGFAARQAQFNALQTDPGPAIPDPSK